MRQRYGWQITDILRSWRRFTKQEPKQCKNKRPFPKNVILLSWPNFLTDSDSCFDTRWHHSFSFLPPHLIPSHPFPFLSYFQDVFILMNVFTPGLLKEPVWCIEWCWGAMFCFCLPISFNSLISPENTARGGHRPLHRTHNILPAVLRLTFNLRQSLRKRDHRLDLSLVHALVRVPVRNKWHLSNLESFKPPIFCAEWH